MGYTSFISYLDLRRPLVFLCGPAYDENNPYDRRSILKSYINSSWTNGDEGKKDYISAFPIIVDNFFKPEEIQSAGLDIKIKIIEEIISNIAYRTYIFLDTMSTSYELGQFTNFAYDSKNVSVFVDGEYKNRVNNVVGGYIKESLIDCFIEYTAVYDVRGHIFFPYKKKEKRQIPKEIKEKLDKDNPINTGGPFLCPIVFSSDFNSVNNPGTIIYKKEDDKLLFNFSIKNLFYFVSAAYRRVKENRLLSILDTMPKSTSDPCFRAFMDELNKELLTSFVCCSEMKQCKSIILSQSFSASIFVGNLNSPELIYHMLYISFMLANYKGKQTYAVAKYNSNCYTGISLPKNELDFLDIKNKHISGIINKYYTGKDNLGISQRKMRIKKKIRTIVSYKTNHIGCELKYLHNEILKSFLFILPSSDSSFAYKDNRNTKMCIERHKNSVFFAKYDISKFFESITMSSIKLKICDYIMSQFSVRFNKINYSNRLKSNIERDVLYMIRPLFYNYKLPIGYVSSPKLSDFYLYKFDEEMRKINGITYTRYADDILLSATDRNTLKSATEKLKCLLHKERLIINEKKIRFGSLINDGDSFRFLGINLVKRNYGINELTISNRYIIETSKLFCSCTQSPIDKNKLEVIAGRINYIKSISKTSFDKLKHLIAIKLEEKRVGVPHLVAKLLCD